MGFGTLRNRTELCDIANVLSRLPGDFQSSAVSELRGVIKSHDVKPCVKSSESYSVYTSDDDHLKNPDLLNVQYRLKYNALDAGTDLIYGYEPFCDLTKRKVFGETLRELGKQIGEEDWSNKEDDYKRWVFKDFKEKNAWDLTSEELLESGQIVPWVWAKGPPSPGVPKDD